MRLWPNGSDGSTLASAYNWEQRPDMALEADIEFLEAGAVVHGRYEVMRRLKAGGMGAVYEVLDRETHRRRALKTLLPSFVADRDLRERFQLEVRVAAAIESEHVVEVFDAGVDDVTGLPFLVMELLKGETLADALATKGRFDPSEITAILFQAGLALDRTHAAGIVHRDLKPENLFLTRRDDGSLRLKVLDFGIAKIAQQTTQPNTTRNLGTPLYMSPEQIRGDGAIAPAADLYSLGQIVYFLLVGAPYWLEASQSSGGVYSLLLKVTAGVVEAPSARARRAGVTLPPAFDAWFARATARRASERFESASVLVEALGQVFGVQVPRSTTVSPRAAEAPRGVGAPPRPRIESSGDSIGALASASPTGGNRRMSRVLRAGALVALGALAAAGLLWWRSPALPETVAMIPSVPPTPAVLPPAAAPVASPSASLLDAPPQVSVTPTAAAPESKRALRAPVPAKPRSTPVAPKRYDPTDFR
jgi:eukaryotic-like serine/threonine-protein kinase